MISKFYAIRTGIRSSPAKSFFLKDPAFQRITAKAACLRDEGFEPGG
jgi:hypothetical protein